MQNNHRRFLVPIALLGGVLVILQIIMAFMSIFINLDRMVSSTAGSLLSSTNREITDNLDSRFDRMIRIGNLIAGDDAFRSYDRTESTLPGSAAAATELSIGRSLSNYTALDDFCDCCIVYRDNSYLGQIDTHTSEVYSDDNLFSSFSDLRERDDQNFSTGYDGDYTRIYYSKSLNSNAIVLVSILCESLDTIFYDGEENHDMTLHVTTSDHHIIYSTESDEMINRMLDTDLSQAVESSDHISMEMRGSVIASDVCDNGIRVTSTISKSSLTAENGNLRALYLIFSIVIMLLCAFMIFLMCRAIVKRSRELEQIESHLEDYANLDDININV